MQLVTAHVKHIMNETEQHCHMWSSKGTVNDQKGKCTVLRGTWLVHEKSGDLFTAVKPPFPTALQHFDNLITTVKFHVAFN